ncbi:RHS repeat-associated core domain-containing protein [Pseudomonas sp. zfem004]|uniref:RHS repeat-associated core domain-containing protein n=1 Tax=Pseudomonas sp. zfem004 TaxID=3078199 RepID=UPI00292A08BB|nr:RHS repeat-associated core domain-containing protein [Pseudomonas sp. zfem004]MDU9405620.1 RHS repeat-associated core domain-containing protein [Pseudomonas sp. zfem004]
MNDLTAQFYFYRGIQLATSINGGERISLFSGGHMPLAEVAGKDAPVNSSLYGVDSLNTIQSNRQGKPENYTVYGFAHRSAQFSTLLGFTGQHCQLNGDYLLGCGHRVYSPNLMRFLSPDGLSPFGRGGINAYAYCGGDSVNYSDPLGASKWFRKWVTRITGYANKEKTLKKGEQKVGEKLEADLKTFEAKRVQFEADLKRFEAKRVQFEAERAQFKAERAQGAQGAARERLLEEKSRSAYTREWTDRRPEKGLDEDRMRLYQYVINASAKEKFRLTQELASIVVSNDSGDYVYSFSYGERLLKFSSMDDLRQTIQEALIASVRKKE